MTLAHESPACHEIPALLHSAACPASCNTFTISSLATPPPLARTDLESLDLIQSLTLHADQLQAHILASILHTNAHTEYLQRFGLQPGANSRHSFKSLLPVTTYEDLQPDIWRIANGDTSPILSAVPISEFFTSSGTSGGERKLMPAIPDDHERQYLFYSLLMPIINQYFPKGRGMYFYFIKSETKALGGLPARPTLTSYYKSHWFRKSYDGSNTSPIETILCTDTFQSMYCQILCGLLQRADVVYMGTVFASSFLRGIHFLQNHWQQLCHDIRTGKLSDVITDELARKVVCQLLAEASGQREELAESITSVCARCEERGSWNGIIRLVWPRTKYIQTIVTGAMAQYVPMLDMLSGGLPLVCSLYASSECYFGVNLQPMSKPSDVSYTILPNMAYFEFLPVQGHDGGCSDTGRTAAPSPPANKDHQQLLDLVDVKLGCEYELVVTTYGGLYRYRVGDILRVTGFHNKAPQFQFVCRKDVMLSIESDKTDENMLHRAVEAATTMHLHHASVVLVDYTSHADLSTTPGHYVLFWELQHSACHGNASDHEQLAVIADDDEILKGGLLEKCCLSMEEALDSVYRQGRASDKSIGPLEIRVVQGGSFEAVMDYCLNHGASISQYKSPRCVKAGPLLELLNSRVTFTHFSPCCPSWRPVAASQR